MTPSQQAKAAGLKSLRQMSRLCCVPVSTLEKWHKTRPDRFEALLDLAAAFVDKP